ncbi:MAG: hypothetical protein Q8O82_06080, partial [Pseudorhodobacter sp.]|nr:hypothetical protein [Pseudorhodobacter sp.]
MTKTVKSTCGSQEARKPVWEATEASWKPPVSEGPDSTSKFLLTKLPPLTHTLIIEEWRPEEPPRGRFRFPDIADPDPAADRSGRALAS